MKNVNFLKMYLTSKDCIAKYGDPIKENNMVLWDVSKELEIGIVPKKIYCNKDLILPLEHALKNLIERKYINELKTWDGCFNIRKSRGLPSLSLHSWGLAIDVNASWNGLGKQSTLSKGFVKCFLDAGFNWGGNFSKRKDPMHFELSKI